MNITGKNIKILRQKQGWSQGDAARQLNISIPAFSKIETGVTDPSLSRLNQIADLFQVPITTVIHGESDHSLALQSNENALLRQKVNEQEVEIIKLQRKVIELYEEIAPIKI